MNKSPATTYSLGAYVGTADGSDPVAEAAYEANYASFVSTMGAQPQFMVEYVDQRVPIDQWINNASWAAWSAAKSPIASGMTPVIGLPMASTAASAPSADQMYKNFAAGLYDATLQGVVKAWANNGFQTQYWRPGWEMNLNSMPSYAGDDAGTRADWVAAFQHISTVLHAAGTADGVNVKVVWNPGTSNYSSVGPATQTVYPGNQYVDVIGADVYSDLYPYGIDSALYDWDKSGQVYDSSKPVYDSSLQQWASDPVNLTHYWTNPAATQWSADGSVGHALSLQTILDFAKAQGKPVAIAETGAGNTADGAGVPDDPAFVQWLSTTLAASGVPISFVNVWDSNGGGNYEFSKTSDGKPLEAAAWAKYFGAQAPAPTPAPPVPAPVPPPPPASVPVPTPPVALPIVTIGSGPSVLALSISEDAWQGDAQYTVSVDGAQVGGIQTAAASHAAGQDQVVDVLGTFAPGAHTASVNFINDAYGGSAAQDRNLYVDGATVNGAAIPNAASIHYSTGAQAFAFTVPPSPDVIDLHIAEDAWQGDAQYTVAIDGAQVGGVRTAASSHAAGQWQDVQVAGNWGSGAHTLGVSFINDAYGGSPTTDRNLYVVAASYDGRAAAGAPATLLSNVTQNFAVAAAPPPGLVTLHLSEDAWQGDAQYAVAVDGHQVGPTNTTTASHAMGASQAVGLQALLAPGTHDVAVSFLNDAYGGSATTDRNLYVDGIDVGGHAVAGASVTLYSNVTAHFQVSVPSP